MDETGAGGPVMKVIGLHSAMLTAIVAIALALAGSADVSGRTAPRPRVGSKVEYCMDCHGPCGQGLPRSSGASIRARSSEVPGISWRLAGKFFRRERPRPTFPPALPVMDQ